MLLGIGLGALFDGIVLHQILQWHQMVSGWYPPDSLANIRLNVVWDGIFHAAAWTTVVVGVYSLVQRQRRAATSRREVGASMLVGWGGFNVVEGVVDHALLGIHRVNETVPLDERVWWDIAFLAWGASMVLVGVALLRTR